MYCACCEATGVFRMLCCCLFGLSVRFVLRIDFAESVGYCPDHGVRFPVGQRYFRSAPHIGRLAPLYEGCPESISPFWISREPVAWPWCNLAASQRRPYCASVNSHSPVGLVSRQWDAVDWGCVLCELRIHNDQTSKSASSWHSACPFNSSRAGFFGKASHRPGLSAPLQPRFDSLRLLDFLKAKITV